MELRQFVTVIWKRLWLIVFATILVTVMTYYMSATMTPIYSAAATLEIDLGSDPRSDIWSAAVASERLAKTYVEQIKAPVLLRQASEALGVGIRAADVAVSQVRDTQLINITVESPDPGFAQAAANRVTEVFIQQNEAKQQARFDNGKRDLDRQVADLEKSIEETQKAITSLGVPEDPKNAYMPEFTRLELSGLQTQLSSYQTRYTILLKSGEDFRLAAARQADNLRVFSAAELPRSPVKPRVMLNTMLGLISGLVLGVSSAFLMEYLDDTIKTADDVTASLGLTTLANVVRLGRVKKPEDSLVTSLGHRSPAVEAYRTLRTNLEFCALGNPTGSILVTSASPREGKTTTIANLGIIMAQAGQRVALVDTDLHRPMLHRVFDLDNTAGLTSLFIDKEIGLDTVMKPTQVENLSVLTSGPVPPNPAEFLAAQRMNQILEEMKGRAEVVLLDSPPVLAVSDAGILGPKVGGVLLVLDVRMAREGAAKKAQESLEQAGAKIIGVVLNKQSAKKGTGYYYYNYYSQGGDKDKKKRK